MQPNPGALLRTGLLSERDREKFRQADHALSAGGKEKAYVQKFYLYMNLTKPSEKLKVYYSKVSADGKALRPSYLIQELLRLYPDVKVRDEDEKELVQKELTEKTGVKYLDDGLLEANLDGILSEEDEEDREDSEDEENEQNKDN